MDEILENKRRESKKNARRGGVRFLGWGFGNLTDEKIAQDFCAVQKARSTGQLKAELVSSFGF